MTLPAMHGWAHRFRWLGGSDPIPMQLPYIYGKNLAGQSVTDDAELQFDTDLPPITNDGDTFAFDPADPGGLLIMQRGLYRFTATVFYVAGSISVEREMYVTCQSLAAGPLAGLGSAVGDSGWGALGNGQNESSLGVVTATNTIPKSLLAYQAIGRISATGSSIQRAAVILQHNTGLNYTVESNLDSVLFIERIGEFGSTAPLPPAA